MASSTDSTTTSLTSPSPPPPPASSLPLPVPPSKRKRLSPCAFSPYTPMTGPPTSTTTTPPDTKRELLLQNDPSITGFDPNTSWWLSYFNILLGNVTPEGIHHYREWRYAVHSQRDVAACEANRDWLFKYSPTIRFLQEKITPLNGGRPLDGSNVLCRSCPSVVTEGGEVRQQGGGFNPGLGILLCANVLKRRKHLEDTLAHEMVHAYDHLRFKVDFGGGSDLRHAACTEIRAAMLSGECRWSREFITRGNWSLTQQFQNCVRRHAVESVSWRPSCKDEAHATKVVNEVWDSCFSDTRPFDEVYR